MRLKSITNTCVVHEGREEYSPGAATVGYGSGCYCFLWENFSLAAVRGSSPRRGRHFHPQTTWRTVHVRVLGSFTKPGRQSGLCRVAPALIAAATPTAPLGTAGNVPSSFLNHGRHLDPDLVLLPQPRTLFDLGHLVDLAEQLGLGRPTSVRSVCGGGRKTPVAAAVVAPRGADVAPIPELGGPK